MDAHQDDKCADEIQKGNDCIFRTVMVEFGKIKCVMGDSGHELSGFVLIVEFEGELLIVIE